MSSRAALLSLEQARRQLLASIAPLTDTEMVSLASALDRVAAADIVASIPVPPWDNAAMESFFARLKVESIYAEPPRNKSEAYSGVFEYIEMFYNTVRRHSANGQKSPNAYEQEYYARCA